MPLVTSQPCLTRATEVAEPNPQHRTNGYSLKKLQTMPGVGMEQGLLVGAFDRLSKQPIIS